MKHAKQLYLLSPEDILFLPTLAKFLKTLKGMAKAMTNRQIQAKFPKQFTGVSRSKLTAMIHEIRVRKLVPNLIGSPNGFYVSRNKDVIVDYVDTLKGHISARKESADSFGPEPGKDVKQRYKVKGFKNKNGTWVKGYYRTYPGYKYAEQTSIDFEAKVDEKLKKGKKKNPMEGQPKLF